MTSQKQRAPRVLVVDIGGNNVKVLAQGQKQPIKIPSGPRLTPQRMVREVKLAAVAWQYDCISIGYPGPVIHGKIMREPRNLGKGWVKFDFQKTFGKPVKIVNDAAMQAIGSYEAGRMLFLGLGTGLGSALIVDGVLEPMELAHLPYRKGKTYEDYVGNRGMLRLGKKKWRKHVANVVEELKAALDAEYVVLGGGNIKYLKKVPAGIRLGSNDNAFKGGFRLWKNTPAGMHESAKTIVLH